MSHGLSFFAAKLLNILNGADIIRSAQMESTHVSGDHISRAQTSYVFSDKTINDIIKTNYIASPMQNTMIAYFRALVGLPLAWDGRNYLVNPDGSRFLMLCQPFAFRFCNKKTRQMNDLPYIVQLNVMRYNARDHAPQIVGKDHFYFGTLNANRKRQISLAVGSITKQRMTSSTILVIR